MSTDQNCLTPVTKTRGDKLEGIAFTFCKAATVILLTQKYALPVASGAAAIFYILAFMCGKRDTRCWLSWPPLIAGFWGTVCLFSILMIISGVSLVDLFALLAARR